jgi:hypothetical protein
MRVTRFLLIAAMLVPLAWLPSSCGGSGPNDDAGAPTPTASSIVPTAALSGSPGANPFETKATPSVLPSPGRSRPCDAELQWSGNAGVPGGNYIRAATRPPIYWGPHCEVLNAGDHCEVQWDGAYSVKVGTEASLRFQAWARGRSKPFKELTAGPLEPENSFRKVGFPVVIPKGVKEVSFRIVLLDTAKVPVAISDAYSYLVGCKPETS